ncbi:hypothetical protein OB955_11935 [Halobacteria archaeon AArc-m2/3/4]|uniref:Uncharacterized protein n=1 Tax=Natronoglomus mannanivorans TaxID=2979990 RepID=A0AAP2YZN0_9EURY|nr:hypothetical protein [Halobacteria archaeon AArc-xg1-1]MCU4973451.1 hypothetical protein [Halobacteria archaeon AArc-m2/3/4]
MTIAEKVSASLPTLDYLKLFDYATQPRFLLPILFPFIVYLGWLRESAGSLELHLLAALAIALGGWLGAMIVEYQPFLAIEDGTVNEIQGMLLFVVAGTIYLLWNQNGWPVFVQHWALVAATAVALWLPARFVLDLSGGVIFPTAVFVYLAFMDFRFAPLLVIPVLRVPVALKIEDLSPLEAAVGLGLGVVSVATVLLATSVW